MNFFYIDKAFHNEDAIKKISEVLTQLKAWHEPFEPAAHGSRGLILVGGPDQECTGIGVTVCATYEVLEAAVRQLANFLIDRFQLNGLRAQQADALVPFEICDYTLTQ